MTEHIEVRKPKPPVSQVSPELVERMISLTRYVAKSGGTGSNTARALMDELEPPVDPLVEVARKMLSEDHKSGHFDFFHEGTMLKCGAGADVIMSGRFDNNYYLGRYLDALRHGLTISKEG